MIGRRRQPRRSNAALSICRSPHLQQQRIIIHGMGTRILLLPAATLLVLALTTPLALSQKKYDPGVTDTEIKVGNIMPYTGAFSEYGSTGRAEAAYFQMINDRGGVNGRKIHFISVDSASDTEK